MINVKVKSAVTALSNDDEYRLEFSAHAVSVKEIIENSVRNEVTRNSTGTVLAGSQRVQSPDIEKEIYVALTAFQKQEYFVLVDHYHATKLEEVVHLRENSEIKFLRVTPLDGG